jgi:hypothetical protein
MEMTEGPRKKRTQEPTRAYGGGGMDGTRGFQPLPSPKPSPKPRSHELTMNNPYIYYFILIMGLGTWGIEHYVSFRSNVGVNSDEVRFGGESQVPSPIRARTKTGAGEKLSDQ